MSTPERQQLADEIDAFLAKHARIAANYEPGIDDPGDRFNGPDPGMLEVAAQALRDGGDVPDVWSSYGSGCYQPLTDRVAAQLHDDLIVRLRYFRPQPGLGR